MTYTHVDCQPTAARGRALLEALADRFDTAGFDMKAGRNAVGNVLGLERQGSRRIWVSAIIDIVFSHYGCSARNSLLCTSKSVWPCPRWKCTTQAVEPRRLRQVWSARMQGKVRSFASSPIQQRMLSGRSKVGGKKGGFGPQVGGKLLIVQHRHRIQAAAGQAAP